MANAIPLIGVLFFGWSVWTILIVYWVENGIVGAFNILKMARAEGDDDGVATRLDDQRPAGGRHGEGRARSRSSSCTTGIFWVVHGVFVLTLPLFASFGPNGGRTSARAGPVDDRCSRSWPSSSATACRTCSTTSAAASTSGRRPLGQMFAPYGRLVILHLTIIFGAIAVVMTGAPAAAVAVLVVLKTALDLGFHLREHRRCSGPVEREPLAAAGARPAA